MKAENYQFEVNHNKDGTVSTRGGYILTPPIRFSGITTKWYEDTEKKTEACDASRKEM